MVVQKYYLIHELTPFVSTPIFLLPSSFTLLCCLVFISFVFSCSLSLSLSLCVCVCVCVCDGVFLKNSDCKKGCKNIQAEVMQEHKRNQYTNTNIKQKDFLKKKGTLLLSLSLLPSPSKRARLL